MKKHTTVRVKSKESKFPPTQFLPILIQHDGGGDQIVFVPVCGRCGKPVLDPTANISTVGGGDIVEVISDTGRVKTSLLSGRGFVFHKGCDSAGNTPWIETACVFPGLKEAA